LGQYLFNNGIGVAGMVKISCIDVCGIDCSETILEASGITVELVASFVDVAITALLLFFFL